MTRLLNLAVFLALGAMVVMPAAPTHATMLAPDTDPRSFVMDSADLGSGFRLNPDQSGPRTNDAAQNRDDVQRYQQWGRVTGYNAQFERESSILASLSGSALIVQAVSLYRTPQGAQQAFDYSRQRNGQTMELLGTPEVGEASLAFRIRQQAGQPGADGIALQFRKGNLVQSFVVVGPPGSPVLDDALNVARLAASRVPD